MALARLSSNRNRCPYCESCLHHRLQRKWFLIEARKCAFCGLIFRFPTDEHDGTSEFYENGYDGQQATDLPDAQTLRQLLDQNFSGTPYDKTHRVDFVKSLRSEGKILDFGCAWGYAVKQFKSAGFDAHGFELARNRARFGREKLDVPLYSDWKELEPSKGTFDIIYTDHALEHTPNLRQPLEMFAELLKPSGVLVMFVPNCGSLVGRRLGVGWGPFIGESHTIAFTDNWCAQNLPRHQLEIEKLVSSEHSSSALPDGEELICVARRT